MASDAQKSPTQPTPSTRPAPSPTKAKPPPPRTTIATASLAASSKCSPGKIRTTTTACSSACSSSTSANDLRRTAVQKIAQHFWLAQRAVQLQEFSLDHKVPMSSDDPGLKLSLRYQVTHDRAYHKLSDELRKIRDERRKEQIGFESQKSSKPPKIAKTNCTPSA